MGAASLFFSPFTSLGVSIMLRLFFTTNLLKNLKKSCRLLESSSSNKNT